MAELTPSQSDKIGRCVDDRVSAGDLDKVNPRTNSKFTKSDLFAICTAAIKKEEGEVMIKEKVSFRYAAPAPILITEGKTDKSSRKIRGVALKARTSRNNVTYVIDEIDKSKQTLIGRNIKVNHSDDVTDNVAKITNAFTEGDQLIYEAEIFNTKKHPDAIEMVENQLIQHVSIEAIAGEVVKEGDKMIAKNLEFTGLAFVDTPGVPEASVAIAEAWNRETLHNDDMTSKTDMDMKTCMADMMGDGMSEDEAKKKCTSMMGDHEEDFRSIYGETKVTDMEAERQRRGMSPDEFYAYPQDPPGTSKLPMFDAAHVRNALSRFNQTKGIVEEEKKAVLKKIIGTAKKFNVTVSDELIKQAGPEEELNMDKTEEKPKENEAISAMMESIKSLSEELKALKEELKQKPKGVVTETKPSSVLPLVREKSRKGTSFWIEDGLTTEKDKLY